MKTTRYMGKGIVGVCLLTGILATQANARSPGHMFCVATPDGVHLEDSGLEIYVSDVFPAPSDYFSSDGLHGGIINYHYEDFIEEKYSLPTLLYLAACDLNVYKSKRTARDVRNKTISHFRERGVKVREVRWSY